MVSQLLENPAELVTAAQLELLDELDVVFSEKDNEMMLNAPTLEEVRESVMTSNSNAAPGNDGLTSMLYKECFHILGEALTDVVKAIHEGQVPTESQRTSLMIFTAKPSKSNSIEPKDKRRLSLLNSDFNNWNRAATLQQSCHPHSLPSAACCWQ